MHHTDSNAVKKFVCVVINLYVQFSITGFCKVGINYDKFVKSYAMLYTVLKSQKYNVDQAWTHNMLNCHVHLLNNYWSLCKMR